MCNINSLPQVQKCCFYLPLKKGLIAWGYMKTAFHVILMFYALMLLKRFIQLSLNGYGLVLTFFLFIILDIIMNIIFLISAHKNKDNLMSIYYVYTFLLLFLYTICFLIYTIIKIIADGDFFYNWAYMLQDCVIGCGNLAIQFYFCVLVKSHIQNIKIGFDPESQPLHEEDEEGKEKRKKKRKQRSSDDKGEDDDHDDNSSESDEESKRAKSGQSNEETKDDKHGESNEETQSGKDDNEN